MTQAPGASTTLVTLAVVLLVVVRFLFRELRARVVRQRTLWIRPALLIVFTIVIAYVAFVVPNASVVAVLGALTAGVVLGAVTGALVVRFTTFEPVVEPGAVRARGSTATVIVWIAALALRFAFRLAFAGGTASVQFVLNVFTVSLVAVAFVVVAIGFRQAITRYRGTVTPSLG